MKAKKQIEILTKAKNNILNRSNPYVCVATSCEINEDRKSYRFAPINMGDYIPLLTFENAQVVCKKYKLKMPVVQLNDAWWKSTEVKSRLAFMNWMIKELQKEL